MDCLIVAFISFIAGFIVSFFALRFLVNSLLSEREALNNAIDESLCVIERYEDDCNEIIKAAENLIDHARKISANGAMVVSARRLAVLGEKIGRPQQ